MYEFMTLQCKTFYMPHYAIGIFLEATTRVIPNDALEAKPGQLAPGEPSIMQWRHLDTLGTKTTVKQNDRRPDGGNTDSGQEETSFEESGTDGKEEEDEEVEVITPTPLRFPRPALSAMTHLAPVGIHGIPRFGQFRQPVVMTPTSIAIHLAVEARAETRAILEALVEVGAEVLVLDAEMDTEVGAMEIPTRKGLRAPGVQLDVEGVDAVVTVDMALLASPKPDRERTHKLSTYLSMRFHRTLAPRVTYLDTPTQEVISEEDPLQAQVEESTQDEGLPHNANVRMAEAIERAMGVQQKHLQAPKIVTRGILR